MQLGGFSTNQYRRTPTYILRPYFYGILVCTCWIEKKSLKEPHFGKKWKSCMEDPHYRYPTVARCCPAVALVGNKDREMEECFGLGFEVLHLRVRVGVSKSKG